MLFKGIEPDDFIHTSFPLKDIKAKIRQASNTNNTGYKSLRISVQFILGLGDALSLMACRVYEFHLGF